MCCYVGGERHDIFEAGSLLRVAPGEAKSLPFAEAERFLTEEGGQGVVLRGQRDSWRYALELELKPGASWVDAKAEFETGAPVRGWFYYNAGLPAEAFCWVYPWLNGGRDITPTLGGHSIGMDCPGHVHAHLAGVPLIIARLDDIMGGLGFTLQHNYQHDSLAYEERNDRKLLGVGKGKNGGAGAFGGIAQYRPGTVYRFDFQLFALQGRFRDLAKAWALANEFQFDRELYYTFERAIDMVVEGRAPDAYQGVRRYVREDADGIPVRGYRHGSNQNRISVYRQPCNAYLDYLLYQRTGREVFRRRAFEQMEFLLAAQTRDGWFQEDWQIEQRDWSYEVIGENGGVTQVVDATDVTLPTPFDALIWGEAIPAEQRTTDIRTGKNIRGPRPDYLGMTCLYIHKFIKAAERHEGTTPHGWKTEMRRCLDWIVGVQEPDGAWPMTVSPDGALRTEPAPAGRLLVALETLGADLDDPQLDLVRQRHEDWVLNHCVATHQWYGSHKDTGLMIDYGGVQSFIQYAIQRYERTREARYLDYALECTYFNFFEHCPKQLEWLWHYSKGGIQEQANYMQPDIDNMDNLPCSSWYKLAQYTDDDFLRGFVDLQVFTMMHSLCDEPADAWYGAWAQYLVDYANAVGRYDQSPVTGNRTKYAGSIVFSVVEDILELEKAGYKLPE
jgi:hypothetical protein